MVEVKKFLRRSAGNDAAAFEQHDARCEKQGFAQIVRDEDDGFAKAAGERREFTLEFRAGDGIERAEWFVHQENRWIGRKGASNADALTLSARELAGVAVGKFRRIKAHQREKLPDACGGAGGVPIFQSWNQGDVFRNREVREETGVLNDVADATAEADGVPIAGRGALDEDFPFCGQ